MREWTCGFDVCRRGLFRFRVHRQANNLRTLDATAEESALIAANGVDAHVACVQVHAALCDGSPLAAMRCVTLVPKWMGVAEGGTWPALFSHVAHAGFNAVHLAPFHVRGASNSPYAIRDHRRISPDVLPPPSCPAADEEGENCETQEQEEDGDEAFARIAACLDDARRRFKLSFVADVVWNHVSSDAPWLVHHENAGYTPQNTPHLQPAFALDEALRRYSQSSLNGVLFADRAHVVRIMQQFRHGKTLAEAQIWRHFVIDSEAAAASFHTHLQGRLPGSGCVCALNAAIFTQNFVSAGVDAAGVWRRIVNFEKLAQINAQTCSCSAEAALEAFRTLVAAANAKLRQTYDETMDAAVQNIADRVCYERLAIDGPKWGAVTPKHPLTASYFTRRHKACHGDGQTIAFANNGWIWNGDARVNFAADADCDAYVRRTLIVWEDCVKLRYGTTPADNPWLWRYMTRYTQQLAAAFDGIRIDNCHSTPPHVAHHLISEARRTNGRLLVVAELFTASAEVDAAFVAALGIDCVVRESLRSTSAAGFVNAAFGYGGRPIGSLQTADSLCAKSPMALLVDFTHDNASPAVTRHSLDFVANVAQSVFCAAPVGSTLGYDDMPMHNRDVVNDVQAYDPALLSTQILTEARRTLYALHARMQTEGYDEFYAEVCGGTAVKMLRERGTDHSGFLLVSAACYTPNDAHAAPRTFEFCVEDAVLQLLHVITLHPKPAGSGNNQKPFACRVTHGAPPEGMQISMHRKSDGSCSVHMTGFAPGSVVIFAKQPAAATRDFVCFMKRISSPSPVVAMLSAAEVNVALFRCAAEEHDAIAMQPYAIPQCDVPIVWCGVAGFVPFVSEICRRNALDDAFCVNIRNGDWFIEHMAHRLQLYCEKEHRYVALGHFAAYFREIAARIKDIAFFYKPKYVFAVLQHFHAALTTHAIELMHMAKRPPLIQRLALTSVQLVGWSVGTGSLPCDDDSDNSNEEAPNSAESLSAGLPFFATRHMRCWGRDTFIATNGLFLCTRRFADARRHLLAFAACMWRGCIPNLLDAHVWPRFNARDSTWWFVKALREYCQVTGDWCVLRRSVRLRFPLCGEYVSINDERAYADVLSVGQILVRLFAAHWNGVRYVEHNAGPSLDHAMQAAGFEVCIGTDPVTGFVSGGNAWNCGTWMDKMGDSHAARTFGVPATSRHGAAVEIVALVHRGLRFMEACFAARHIDAAGFEARDGTFVRFGDWAARIERHFERCFYVPLRATGKEEEEEDACVGRRGIYRDVYNVKVCAEDFALRPNFVVAIAESPDLFDAEHVRGALDIVQRLLVGRLGLRTLDPEHAAYRETYDLNDQSTCAATAHGFNYHNGPEWTWLKAKLMQVLLHIRKGKCDDASRSDFERRFVAPYARHLHASQLHEGGGGDGLPELTNADGTPCVFACFTQAWSNACVLQALVAFDDESGKASVAEMPPFDASAAAVK